jgi:hypothetical protein
MKPWFSKSPKEELLVEFVSLIKGLEEIEECRPKPTKAFIPEWWKSMPYKQLGQEHLINSFGTAKACPSFPDYFSQGFVLPMWTDSILRIDEETGTFNWVAGKPNSPFTWDGHSNSQFLDYQTPYVQGSKGKFVFKAISPWRLITPPGYSVLQLPMFYNFNQDFSVLPGIISTDVHHETNHQVVFHSKEKEIFIKRGTPICQYIPFKRNIKYSLDVRSFNEADQKRFSVDDLGMMGSMSGEYLARKRKADKILGSEQE